MKEKHYANDGSEFIILKTFLKPRKNSSTLNHRMWVVQFTETGTTMTVYRDNACKGKLKDPYKRSVYGQGYLGFVDKSKSYYKQANQLWRNMMKRCYSQKDTKGYYGKAFVDERWKCFSNFLEDLPKLNNFNLWLKGFKSGVKYNLDKDLLSADNKIYSRDTCQFVTEYENKSEGAKNGKPYTKKLRVAKEITNLS